MSLGMGNSRFPTLHMRHCVHVHVYIYIYNLLCVCVVQFTYMCIITTCCLSVCVPEQATGWDSTTRFGSSTFIYVRFNLNLVHTQTGTYMYTASQRDWSDSHKHQQD